MYYKRWFLGFPGVCSPGFSLSGARHRLLSTAPEGGILTAARGAAGTSILLDRSGQSPEAWIFVLAIWAYPLFPLVMAIGAWIAFAFRKDRLAAILSGLAFAPPVLLYLVIWIGP